MKTNQPPPFPRAPQPGHSSGPNAPTPPIPQTKAPDGQSVENAPAPSRRWYAARVTYGRSRAVYEAIRRLGTPGVTPYLPVTRRQVCQMIDGKASVSLQERPVHTGLLFINASPESYRSLLRSDQPIPGLTPFYDHFSLSHTGRNNYLVVPDRQFDSFRRILEADSDDILVDQRQVPDYLAGKHVRVISGPFVGVEGTLLKWKHQRRVFVDLGLFGKYGTGYIRTCDFEIIP